MLRRSHRAAPLTAAILLLTSLTPAATLARQPPPQPADTAHATVFFPNPVAQLGDESLTDRKDADYAALQPAYVEVTLTHLDGSGYLCGDFACVVSSRPGTRPSRPPASTTTTATTIASSR